MDELGRLFPTARVRLQRKGDAGRASEYVWNRGDGKGLQFEGTVDVASGKDGVESVLNLKIYNVPRAQRGEVPLSGGLVSLDLGYEDGGQLSPVFFGHVSYGLATMEGGTSVWNVYATVKSKEAAQQVHDWTPALKNSANASADQVTFGALIDEFASNAGIQVTVPPSLRGRKTTPSTWSGSALDVINSLKNTAMRDLKRPFLLLANPTQPDTYVIADVVAGGIPIVTIDPRRESVYQAGYQIVQKEAEPDEPEEDDDGTPVLAPTAQEEGYSLFYEMELPFRNEIKCGVFVSLTLDPNSGAPVRFLVTSISYAVGPPWSMMIRGPVDGGAGLVV